MPPKILYNLENVDFNKVEYTQEEVQKFNPQRFEFAQLDGIYKLDIEEKAVVGFRNIQEDEFWVRGHIPGNPIFPGVLMLEAAAQLSSFFITQYFDDERFIGFGGVDNVRFRGTVRPGDHMILIASGKRLSKRVSLFGSQGIVNDKVVFEADITGVYLS